MRGAACVSELPSGAAGEHLDDDTRLASTLASMALVSPRVASAQAVLTLGTVKGAIQFTNGNPEVLGLMDQCGLTGAMISATSSDPAGYNASSGAPVSGPTSESYEVLVEADAQ